MFAPNQWLVDSLSIACKVDVWIMGQIVVF